MPRDYEALALSLLAPYEEEPVPRARRIAAIYAALYLEDPLLHQWCGLAAFVARQIYVGLETNTGPLQDNFASGNLGIYKDVVPTFLRFRDGAPIHGALESGFNALRKADLLARHDLRAAEALAARGLAEIAEVEQRVVCQPVYDAMLPITRRALTPFVLFRAGVDSASPIFRFHGSNPGDVEQRMRWVAEELLPQWAALHRDHGEQIRADCDVIRREGEVRIEDLPPREPPRRPARPLPPGHRSTWSTMPRMTAWNGSSSRPRI